MMSRQNREQNPFINLRIREATPLDLEDIIDFNQRLALESEAITLDREILQKGVMRILKTPALGKYYLAEIESEKAPPLVIGQTMITFEPTDWRDGIIVWLQSVYVKKDYRRKGVFQRLYRHVKEDAKNCPWGPVRLIRLYVEKENRQGILTYENLGMNVTDYLVYESQDLNLE